jgi:hypothetical protein
VREDPEEEQRRLEQYSKWIEEEAERSSDDSEGEIRMHK